VKTKKPSAVETAERALTVKERELFEAIATVQRLTKERAGALIVLNAARVEADSALPKCRLVLVSRRSGEESENVPLVILRKTPGGMIVARRVGDAPETASKYKWQEHSGKFVQAEKQSSYSVRRVELRDVPSEFLPKATP
jgi:hypothetical protein